MEIPGRLVVRTYAPARRWIMVAILLLLTGLALLCRCSSWDATRPATMPCRRPHERDALQDADRQARAYAARAARAAGGRGGSAHRGGVGNGLELARTIGELQAQVEREQQELGFYRGLLAQPGQPAADAVRVQQFHIVTLPGEQHFSLRFSLSRTAAAGRGDEWHHRDHRRRHQQWRPRQHRSGGAHQREERAAVQLPLFCRIEQPVTLPGDFKPDRITIEVRPGRKGVAPYRQTFVWNADPVS